VAHAWVVCLPGRNRRRTYARVALPCALPAVVVLQIGGRPKADRWYAQSECIHIPSVVPRAQVWFSLTLEMCASAHCLLSAWAQCKRYGPFASPPCSSDT
jgi:hypothetical protein